MGKILIRKKSSTTNTITVIYAEANNQEKLNHFGGSFSLASCINLKQSIFFFFYRIEAKLKALQCLPQIHTTGTRTDKFPNVQSRIKEGD